ncbi:MAG: ribonuclease Y [Clostridia bacterium]|nr:ribonuclease Y [Clostridia bacterium]
MKDFYFILIGIAAGAIIGIIVGYFIGVAHRKKVAEAAIGSAEKEANKIVSEALATAEAKKKESILEAKDEIHKQRSEAEKEIRERRSEVQRQEKRLIQKEENLDLKTDKLEKKEAVLEEKIKNADAKIEEVESLKKSQLDILERISGYTQDQAKALIISELDQKLDHEKAVKIQEYEQQTREDADNIAKEIITTAIQRCAADHASEATVSVVSLPNDEMKGRIIGRDGRNVRTLEMITGVSLIIDDTPEVITISSFEPVRREIARITIEKLIQDGRIHPARIEELYEKAKRDVEQTIKQTGERALMEAGVDRVNPELVKLLGRLRYRTSYGQNVLKHSLEVSYLAGLMASELGVDVKTAKRAGLLHDIGKALDHEMEGTHVALGVEYARRYKENETICNAIEAHHGGVEPKSTVAVLVQAADAISAARPGARREDLQNYIKRLETLEGIATGFEGVERSFAIQAGREVRIIVKPEMVSDDRMVIMAKEIAEKIENSMDYPGEIKVNLIRETRAFGVAK